jgi:hypothetical protein
MGWYRRKEGDVTQQNSISGLTSAERKLVECYEQLAQLLREERTDLAPFAERNAIKAVAALWQVVNGLDLEPGQIYDIGG